MLCVEPCSTAIYNVKLLLPCLEAARSSGERTGLQRAAGSRQQARCMRKAVGSSGPPPRTPRTCAVSELLGTAHREALLAAQLCTRQPRCANRPALLTARRFVSTASHEHGSLHNQHFISILASTTVANRKTIS